MCSCAACLLLVPGRVRTPAANAHSQGARLPPAVGVSATASKHISGGGRRRAGSLAAAGRDEQGFSRPSVPWAKSPTCLRLLGAAMSKLRNPTQSGRGFRRTPTSRWPAVSQPLSERGGRQGPGMRITASLCGLRHHRETLNGTSRCVEALSRPYAPAC
jgi:hypothetical protein